MYCVSISHKTCGVEVRKRFAFSEQAQIRLLHEAICRHDIKEALALCTCSRTELYFCGEKTAAAEALKILESLAGMKTGEIKRYVYLFYDDKALKHLFEVACGMDSMVIGEDEILGQLKSAYALAKENGSVGAQLNMSVQAAIACAKKSKTETAISKSALSSATLAANEAVRFKSGEINVLLIGASGKVGQAAAKNLISHKSVSLTVTRRTHGGSVQELEDLGAEIIPYSERYSAADKADCIISATSGPHYTITLSELKKKLKTKKKRLFIDLAVPPDIDSDISKESGVRLLDIDYINGLAEKNSVQKLESIRDVREIIGRELDELKKSLAFRDFLPTVKKLEAQGGESFTAGLIYKLKAELNYNEFIKVLEVYKKHKEGY